MVKTIQEQKMIGVVGGVGPYAGLDLVEKIFDQTEARSDQEHLPVAMLSVSQRVADRTSFLLGKKTQNPAYAISDIILTLEKIGASIVGIPCNTAHARPIWDKIQERLKEANSSVTLFHMIEEVAKFICNEHSSFKNVGVLSTTGTYKTKVYPNILVEKGLRVILTEKALQEKVHDAIYNPDYGIKSYSNPVTERSKNQLRSAISELRNNGAEAVILGCTELPLAITEQIVDGCLVIDPTLILARALIQTSNPDKLKHLEIKGNH